MSVPADVLAAMRRNNEVFETRVVQQQNFKALEQVYTADARVLPPGALMISGLDEIKLFWRNAINGLGVKDAKLETLHSETSGEQLLEIGKAVLGLRSGQAVELEYVVYWKRDGELWK